MEDFPFLIKLEAASAREESKLADNLRTLINSVGLDGRATSSNYPLHLPAQVAPLRTGGLGGIELTMPQGTYLNVQSYDPTEVYFRHLIAGSLLLEVDSTDYLLHTRQADLLSHKLLEQTRARLDRLKYP